MKTILHKAESRGHEYHGWLDTHHTFSFANYYNPSRVHFGALRVLNDDKVAEGKGFGMHPHDNMEIITIPLQGAVEHEDSMHNKEIIHSGEIQVMSAGTGVFHSEFSKKGSGDTILLQIWIFPNKKNVVPRYDKISFADISKPNELYQILSPNKEDQGVWIYQNAWFHLGEFSENQKCEYQLKGQNTGVYVFVITGKTDICGQNMNTRDGIGIWDVQSIQIKTEEPTQLLIMEVPIN